MIVSFNNGRIFTRDYKNFYEASGKFLTDGEIPILIKDNFKLECVSHCLNLNCDDIELIISRDVNVFSYTADCTLNSQKWLFGNSVISTNPTVELFQEGIHTLMVNCANGCFNELNFDVILDDP
jgi:hypothetical protein